MKRVTESILVLGSGARAALFSLAFVAVAGVSAAQGQFEFRSTLDTPQTPSASTTPATAGARTAPTAGAQAQGQRAARGERAGRGGKRGGGAAGAATKPPPSSLDLWTKSSGGRGRGGRNSYGSMGGGRGMGGMGGMSMGGMGHGSGGMSRGMGGMSMGGMGGMGRGGMGGMGGMGMQRQTVQKLPDHYTPPAVTASGPIFARGISAPSGAPAPAAQGRGAGKQGKQRAKNPAGVKPTGTDAAVTPATGVQPAAGTQPPTQVF